MNEFTSEEQLKAHIKNLCKTIYTPQFEEMVNIYTSNEVGGILNKTPEEFKVIKDALSGLHRFYSVVKNEAETE